MTTLADLPQQLIERFVCALGTGDHGHTECWVASQACEEILRLRKPLAAALALDDAMEADSWPPGTTVEEALAGVERYSKARDAFRAAVATYRMGAAS